MADWSPLSGVPELMRIVGGAAPPLGRQAGAPCALAPAPAPEPRAASPTTAARPVGGLGG